MISAKTKIYFTTLCFMVLFVLLALLAVQPILSTIKDKAKELSRQEATLKLIESQLAALTEFELKRPLYQEYMVWFDQAFVSADAPVGFMEFLEEQASIANLEMEISPLTRPPKEKFSIGFRIEIGGAFSACLTFLERLEHSPWLVEVDNLNMNRVGQTKSRSSTVGKFGALPVGSVILSFEVSALTKPAIETQNHANQEEE